MSRRSTAQAASPVSIASRSSGLTDSTARHDGTGNPDYAANFGAIAPTRPANDTFPWPGDFHSRYQQTRH